jgi:hypothetical protein
MVSAAPVIADKRASSSTWAGTASRASVAAVSRTRSLRPQSQLEC